MKVSRKKGERKHKKQREEKMVVQSTLFRSKSPQHGIHMEEWEEVRQEIVFGGL